MPFPIIRPVKLSDADQAAFDRDLKDVHLCYDYHVKTKTGSIDKWRYEVWYPSSSRVVYAMHGGPMAGRKNFQTASYQCIREGELWQINWHEETGTIGSSAYDITRNKYYTIVAFSKGH
ncbi:hypothetical protein CB0940_02352 [Cercospora beticola]|uniref:Uncharacterized protein n=1 Tax=Cercospora beticola TaxID=122368 RepID=A0A2G5I3Z2_CERBT|nr:hypothetical protein CB0940_02352 [Cercospora beticola]PIA99509.1 hypothetical protein CB0940_02352 [Cercospora beticola]WPA99482.1 hypothetical protein RHO25_004099 [Cercospora beticola]